MTLKERQQFINQIIKTTQDMLLSKVNKMPDTWNGLEIRHYTSNYLNISNSFKQSDKKRFKDFQNDLLISPL